MTHIVALAGAEQINEALATGADIIPAGRTTDTAIIAPVRFSTVITPGRGTGPPECGTLQHPSDERCHFYRI